MSHESHELALFAINDGGLYRQRILPIIANLKKKIAKGVYDPALALKLWKYAADDAAQRYTKEFDAPGRSTYGIFTVQLRKDAAREMADYYEEHLREPTRNPRRAPSASILAAHARGVKARKNPSGFTSAQKRKIRTYSREMTQLTGYHTKRTRKQSANLAAVTRAKTKMRNRETYIELRGVTSGKVYARMSGKHSTMADMKAMAAAIARRYKEAISAERKYV